jgi:hypothetical protein
MTGSHEVRGSKPLSSTNQIKRLYPGQTNRPHHCAESPVRGPTGPAERVTDDGIPLCPTGLPMRRHSYDAFRYRISDNCPVKRPIFRQGQLQWIAHIAACPRQILCQPHTCMGPMVYVHTTDNPRL